MTCVFHNIVPLLMEENYRFHSSSQSKPQQQKTFSGERTYYLNKLKMFVILLCFVCFKNGGYLNRVKAIKSESQQRNFYFRYPYCATLPDWYYNLLFGCVMRFVIGGEILTAQTSSLTRIEAKSGYYGGCGSTVYIADGGRSYSEILAFPENNQKAYIIDPTIRLENNGTDHGDIVHLETQIYEKCATYIRTNSHINMSVLKPTKHGTQSATLHLIHRVRTVLVQFSSAQHLLLQGATRWPIPSNLMSSATRSALLLLLE
ncbi:hypothetical protein C0J52_02502 [Blattella germanica]|nr:hypothetical protein C0J52_02502 [Blattella germanica]